jgi:hypothetical protein
MRDLAPAAAAVTAVRQDCRCHGAVTALADAVADVIAAVRDLQADQPAPVVTIARGPLDFQPEAAITLATVVPEGATAEWWRSRVAPLTPDEEATP